MLELPEALTLSHQAAQALTGKTIETVVAAQSPHGFGWYNGDPALYPALLEGRAITGAQAHSGLVELHASDVDLVFNDGTNLRLLSPGTPPPKKHQLLLAFADGSALVCTVQMYGGMMAHPAGSYENPYYLVAVQKPSPLTDAFDEAYFGSIVAAAPPKLSAKALLATEQRIPGLGNGCLQDILFNAQVHPQSKLSALADADLAALFSSVKTTLARMAQGGGRDTEKDLFGNPGGYATILSAKTRAYPCPRCGGPVTRKAFLGGNVYFCAACQPLKT